MNTLTGISSAERSDGKGHVIRFHMNQAISNFDFSQPQAYLVQLEITGKNIDSTNIQLQDESDIIRNINYYTLNGGLGMDIFLKENDFYEISAYPDRNSPDLLMGLTKTNGKTLAEYIEPMRKFSWSDAPEVKSPFVSNESTNENTAADDTSYQKIKDKIKFDVVVLDPGHGGHDTGAIGPHRTYEKNVVLDIAKKVGGYINKYLPDVKVVYTRETDKFIELEERGSIANRAQGDLFVSIHCNAAGSRRAKGTETYFLGLERSQTALEVMKRENTVVSQGESRSVKKLSQEDLLIYELANSGYISNSEKIAGMLQNQFKNRAQRHSRGVKQARFVVLYHASMPSILIETGFITNPSEQQYLTSDYGQSIIASAIFRSIRNYKQDFEKSQNLTQ